MSPDCIFCSSPMPLTLSALLGNGDPSFPCTQIQQYCEKRHVLELLRNQRLWELLVLWPCLPHKCFYLSKCPALLVHRLRFD